VQPASPLRRLLGSDTFGKLGGGWGGNSWGRSYGGFGGGYGYNRELLTAVAYLLHKKDQLPCSTAVRHDSAASQGSPRRMRWGMWQREVSCTACSCNARKACVCRNSSNW
jgi:hypothetical protein